jgi:hypothetical protein
MALYSPLRSQQGGRGSKSSRECIYRTPAPNLAMGGYVMSSNGTIIATAAISGAVAVLVGGLGAFTTTHVANVETNRKILEYSLKRRSESRDL